MSEHYILEGYEEASVLYDDDFVRFVKFSRKTLMQIFEELQRTRNNRLGEAFPTDFDHLSRMFAGMYFLAWTV